MAVISIDKKLFEKEIGKIDEKMKEKIALFGTPLESVSNEKIELEIFPDRPDLLSYHGFKRSFLSFLEKKPGLRRYKLQKLNKDYKVIVESSVKQVRPCTVCAVIKGLKLDDIKIKELIELQEKLHTTVGRKRKKAAIGIYPLDKIKFPITYKAFEPDKIKFVPLGTNKEMSGLQILQRHPVGKAYASLLAGKSKFPIFIDSNKNIMSMPPIINSQLTGQVSIKTKDIFIECSGFSLDILEKCLNILVTSFAEMGGKIFPVQIKYPKTIITPNLTPSRMKISLKNTNKLLGLNLNEKELKKLLRMMGYDYGKGEVEIPSWRVDILHEVDLIEDVAIAYGYNNFEPEIPKISTIGEEDPKEILKRKISEILVGLNMLEVSNYHLITKQSQILMGLSEKKIKEFIEIEKSKTEFNILRRDLTCNLMKVLFENIDAEYPQRIFEIGKVFSLSEGSIIEKENLCCAISPGNFTEIKQILNYLFNLIEKNILFSEPEDFPPWFVKGRVAEILFKGKKIGFIGEIHPKILKNWKIKMPVSLFEICLEEIFDEIINKESSYPK